MTGNELDSLTEFKVKQEHSSLVVPGKHQKCLVFTDLFQEALKFHLSDFLFSSSHLADHGLCF